MFNLFSWLSPKKPAKSFIMPTKPIQSTIYTLLKEEYQQVYSAAKVTADPSDVDEVVHQLIKGESAYKDIGLVPWYVIGLIHNLECSFDFNTHLFNGDPLTHRTVNEPANQPKDEPDTPHGYSFKLSATRALQFDKLDQWPDWSIPGVLYKLENYNGFGYRLYHSMFTPYLWSGTDVYQKGKYGSDGHFDPNLVSKEVGIVPVLKKLQSEGLI